MLSRKARRCAQGQLHFKTLFICLLFFFFFCSCIYFWRTSSVLSFSAQRLAGPNTKRILHRLSATIICCFSLTIYFLHCFGRLNSPPPTPPLPPPPSQSHTRFSLTLSFSPSLSFGNFVAFHPWPGKTTVKSSTGWRKTSQDFFVTALPPPCLPPLVQDYLVCSLPDIDTL